MKVRELLTEVAARLEAQPDCYLFSAVRIPSVDQKACIIGLMAYEAGYPGRETFSEFAYDVVKFEPMWLYSEMSACAPIDWRSNAASAAAGLRVLATYTAIPWLDCEVPRYEAPVEEETLTD